VLRFEVIARNTRQLRVGRVLERFGDIVSVTSSTNSPG
jgi:hypothetical protein